MCDQFSVCFEVVLLCWTLLEDLNSHVWCFHYPSDGGLLDNQKNGGVVSIEIGNACFQHKALLLAPKC